MENRKNEILFPLEFHQIFFDWLIHKIIVKIHFISANF